MLRGASCRYWVSFNRCFTGRAWRNRRQRQWHMRYLGGTLRDWSAEPGLGQRPRRPDQPRRVTGWHRPAERGGFPAGGIAGGHGKRGPHPARPSGKTLPSMVGQLASRSVVGGRKPGRRQFPQLALAGGAKSGGTRFYRVTAEDVDSDGDGLGDWAEKQLAGFDPAQGDSFSRPDLPPGISRWPPTGSPR